jgi:hypothetical protein
VQLLLQSQRKFTNINYKKVSREGAALSKTSLRIEIRCRLLIEKNRERGGGDAGENKINEMCIESQSCESLSNKRPFKFVKGFSKVNFKKKSLREPAFESERVNDLLCENNI